jgi:hypothetical protein
VRLCILTVGAGEVTLARELGLRARARRHDVVFVLPAVQRRAFELVSGDFECLPFRGPDETLADLERLAPDVLCCASAITTSGLLGFDKPPHPRPLCVSIDAHWLWNDQPSFRSPDWFDLHLVPFPEALFRLGLADNGGAFRLAASRTSKVFPCGFFTGGSATSSGARSQTRRTLGVGEEERVAFLYLGQLENWHLPPVLEALERIAPERGLKIVLKLNFKTPDAVEPRPWLVPVGWVDDFDALLAAADVAILHNAHATIPKALVHGLPTIVITPEAGAHPDEKPQAFEMQPYTRLGLCQVIASDAIGRDLEAALRAVTSDPSAGATTLERYRAIHEDGLEAALDRITALLRGERAERKREM